MSWTNRQLTRPRAKLVATILEDQRRAHPELAGPIASAMVRAVCARAGIEIQDGHVRRGMLGCCMAFEGDAVITLDPALQAFGDRAWCAVALHELGHAWIVAADPVGEDWRQQERRSRGWGPVATRCELEADLFAARCLGISPEALRSYLQTIRAALLAADEVPPAKESRVA